MKQAEFREAYLDKFFKEAKPQDIDNECSITGILAKILEFFIKHLFVKSGPGDMELIKMERKILFWRVPKFLLIVGIVRALILLVKEVYKCLKK